MIVTLIIVVFFSWGWSEKLRRLSCFTSPSLSVKMEPGWGQLMFKPAAISGQSTSQRAAVNKLLESDQNKSENVRRKALWSLGSLYCWRRCQNRDGWQHHCFHFHCFFLRQKSWLKTIFFVNSNLGAAFGSLLSLVLFKRNLWPITFGLGTGFGIGYSNCQHMVRCSVVFLHHLY